MVLGDGGVRCAFANCFLCLFTSGFGQQIFGSARGVLRGDDNQMTTKAQPIGNPKDEGDSLEQSWSSRCAESIKREKLEAEKKYGIRIGQTEIYCARCGKPCWPGRHVCMDIRLEKLREEKMKEISQLNEAKTKALIIIKGLGPKKVSILLMTPERTVTNWIQRKSVPSRHLGRILNLQKREKR